MASASRPINVALVGLGFGAEFAPIYQQHPDARLYALCQRSPDKLDALADALDVEVRTTRFEDLLGDPRVDAIHINTPIADHARHTCAALRAGKHVACTVPMATTVEDCREIVKLTRETGRRYMMMETTVYAREMLYVRQLLTRGELGRVQFLQASHQQDMDGWPAYWEGLPPMHYATHCVGPCLALERKSAESVSCFGSGRIDDRLAAKHGSPFAIETCHVKLAGSDVVARIHRSLFATARQYRESFDVYGSLRSFEWPLCEGEDPVIHTRGKPEPEIPQRVKVPDFAHLLPEPIRRFTTKGVYDGEHQHLSFTQGGGHGGSHPHMVHEWLRAIVEDRDPYPNAVESANWTLVGILAHESALRAGEIIPLPDFARPS